MANNDKLHCFPPQDTFWHKYYVKLLCETGDENIAADLTQQLQLQFLEWQSRYGCPRTNIQGFINVACANVLMDWLRKKQGKPEVASLDDECAPEPLDQRPLPDALLQHEQWLRAVRQELDRIAFTLAAVQRFILTNWGMSNDELAQRLHTTPASVATQRHKLKQRLRRDPRLRRLFQEIPGD